MRRVRKKLRQGIEWVFHGGDEVTSFSPPTGRAALMPLAQFDRFSELAGETRAYWHARTVAERLAHVEELREMNYGGEAARALQRILEVVERPRG